MKFLNPVARFCTVNALLSPNGAKAPRRKQRLPTDTKSDAQSDTTLGFVALYMRISKSTFILAAAMMLASNANAKLEGVYTDWAVHSKTQDGEKICYALAKATSKTPSSVKHGDIYFMVANWKSGAAKEQPSLLTSFPLKNQIPPSARIGSSRIPMYADGSEAFVENRSDEKKLVRSMRKGSTMRVDAVSARGTQISYEFSLKGITAALGKAKTVCK